MNRYFILPPNFSVKMAECKQESSIYLIVHPILSYFDLPFASRLQKAIARKYRAIAFDPSFFLKIIYFTCQAELFGATGVGNG